jgi:hypothetical protein
MSSHATDYAEPGPCVLSAAVLAVVGALCMIQVFLVGNAIYGP